ncbi:MAG: SMC-Scp complex subunit ScpB [Desulfobacterales bacterium]
MIDPLKSIIESLLFVSDGPLPLSRLRELLPEFDGTTLKTALQELIHEHAQRQGGFALEEVAGGFQFRTRPDNKTYVQRLLQPPPNRLSQAAMETLAIVAYKQPIIRSDIEHIRGVDCGGVLRVLLERKMIRILGRREIPGRPLIYGTTRQFLEVFGLKNLRELPTPKEIDAFLEPAADELQPPGPDPRADPASEEPAEADLSDPESGKNP